MLRERRRAGTDAFAEVAPVPGFPGLPEKELATRLAEWVRSGDRSGWRGGNCLGFADWCLNVSLPREVGVFSAGLLTLEKGLAGEGDAYPVYKVKIGVRSAPAEREWMEEVLGRTPSRVRFRLDGNQSLGWEETLRWLDWMEGRERIEYLEQPLPVGSEARMMSGMGGAVARIALDESVGTDEGLRDQLESGWPGWLVVKPMLLGSPDRLFPLPSGTKGKLVLSSVFETGIGFSYVLLLSALLGGMRSVDGLGTRGFFGSDGLDGWSPASFFQGRLTGSFFGEIWSRVVEREIGD